MIAIKCVHWFWQNNHNPLLPRLSPAYHPSITRPRYAANELFLAGESYAGIYVPMLAQQVVRHNRRQEEKEEAGVKVRLACHVHGVETPRAGLMHDSSIQRVQTL